MKWRAKSDLDFLRLRSALFSDESLLSYGTNDRGERVCYGVSLAKLNERLDAEVADQLASMPDAEKEFVALCLRGVLDECPSLAGVGREEFIRDAPMVMSCVELPARQRRIARKLAAEGLVEELEFEVVDGNDKLKLATFFWTGVGAEALYLAHAGVGRKRS